MGRLAIFWMACFFLMGKTTQAQQVVKPSQMNYIYTDGKMFMIWYNDTLYKGSTQFKSLLYRYNNAEIISQYKKHQFNKVTGQVLSFVGTLGLVVGIANITQGSNNEQKNIGWAAFVGGFATSGFSYYLQRRAQFNLATAVFKFNKMYGKPVALQVQANPNSAGLVFNF